MGAPIRQFADTVRHPARGRSWGAAVGCGLIIRRTLPILARLPRVPIFSFGIFFFPGFIALHYFRPNG